MMLLLLLQGNLYIFREAQSLWETFRAWMNTEPFPGWRFSIGSANGVMLVSTLVFIFLLELLITIGLQVWERRLMGRMQGRWGPREYGSISRHSFQRILRPILALLAVPALLYGVEYWSGRSYWIGRPEGTAAWLGIVLLAPLAGYFLYRSWNRLMGRRPGLVQLPRERWVLVVLAVLIGLALLPARPLRFAIPDVAFGPNFVPNLTLLCTAVAFVLYMGYMLRYYWKQGLYDTVKIFFKEDVMPLNADKLLYLLAPIMVYLPALLSWIVIPFGAAVVGGHVVYYTVQDLNIGLLLIIADFALFLVAVIMAGYASNNKYALVGAMREAAMLLTYEVPMLMCLLCVAVFAGSLNLTEIVERQSMTWGILPLFPAFVIYLVVALAECNRPPFDLPEAQNELLGGYLVEYSGLRFALYYVAEYSNIFIVSAIMTVCFLGGWKGPLFLGWDGLWLSSLFWFLLKTYALVAFFVWARATMPRIRIDQIMFFSWKFLLPVSTLVLLITALGVQYRHPWFSANRIYVRQPDGSGDYVVRSTAEIFALLTVHEKVFFWGYSFFALLVAAFVIWFAWGVLAPRKRIQHPLPRREVTWS